MNAQDDLFAMFCVAFGDSSLHTLSVAWSGLEDISPISRLTSLRVLSLQSTRIANVGPIAALAHLTYLDVSGLRYVLRGCMC